MTLKDLERAIEDLRARGIHPLTPVVVEEPPHSLLDIDCVEVGRGNSCVILKPETQEGGE